MARAADEVVRQWFDEVWNHRDETAIDRLASPDLVVHGLSGPGGPPLEGTAAFKPIFQAFTQAFDDLQITVERTFVDGDVCTAWCRVQGRHTGAALGGPPTNRQVDFRGITVTRAQDGRLVEGWNVFDFLAMYQQLGWVANPVTPR